jgi:tetratricopeptide (TPR) repeat protein
MKHLTIVEIEEHATKVDEASVRAHLEECRDCAATARAVGALGDPLTWKMVQLPHTEGLDEPVDVDEWQRELLDRIESAARLRHADPAEAVGICDEVLRRTEKALDTEGGRHLTVLALRERANALRVMGDLRAALETLGRARPIADELLVSDYENAILDYVEATVLFEQDDLGATEALARRSEATLTRFGDSERARKARFLDAAVQYKRGDFAAARDVFLAVLESMDAIEDRAMEAGLMNNLADCEVNLGRFAEAGLHIARAAALYRKLGMRTELVRLSWLDARIALGTGDVAEAERLFRETEAGFLGAGLTLDAALVGLELVDLWQREGRHDEIAAYAAQLASVFAGAGTRMSLATALAALRDAAIRGDDLTVPVSTARTTIEALMAEG